MTGKKDTRMGIVFMVFSMAAGGLVSAALAPRLAVEPGGSILWSLILGAVFSGVGWLLAENIGDAAFLLLLTGLVGAAALTYVQSQALRVVVIAFVCGFNIGKVSGSIYREYRT